MIYHGVFDYIILDAKPYWMWLMIPLMLFLWRISMARVNRANDRSPLRAVIREEEIKIS
ncbi:hypothetical protein D3C76_1856220 [compost metagenome]